MKRLVFILLLFTVPAYAAGVDEATLPDPAQEERARDLMKEFKCLVCQNQSIEDSNAEMAHDLRVLVRERVELGETDDEVRGFLVERYGDWILMQPPFNPRTALLWLGPVLLLIIGGTGVVFYVRRPRTVAEPQALNAEEQARLDRLLQDDGPVT
ncbi:MAG: cytochrome c-type biogenesis protein CcmH [Alphaproteobacteria bacterium]